MDLCGRRGSLQLGRTGPARCDRLSHERQQSSSAIARGRGGEQRVPVHEEPEYATPVSTTTGTCPSWRRSSDGLRDHQDASLSSQVARMASDIVAKHCETPGEQAPLNMTTRVDYKKAHNLHETDGP